MTRSRWPRPRARGPLAAFASTLVALAALAALPGAAVGGCGRG